uniref:Uncharacterized protein n=1 Tax=Arundo donax TaxID=35708 RepID=A0A0A9L0Q4_ARUDO
MLASATKFLVMLNLSFYCYIRSKIYSRMHAEVLVMQNFQIVAITMCRSFCISYTNYIDRSS